MIDAAGSGKLKYATPEVAKQTVSVYRETAVTRGEDGYTMTLVNPGGAWKVVAFHTN